MNKFTNFFAKTKEKVTNIFKKKENGTKVKETKLKFHREKRPALIISTKLNLKSAGLFLIPLVIAAAGITLGVLTKPNNNIKVDVELAKDDVTHRVFLLSEDNVVVPVSVTLDHKLTKDEEVLDIFELLKDDKKYESNTFKGYIPKDTKLNDIDLQDGVLTLDFTSEFEQLTNKNIRRIVEGLTYTFLDLDGVDGLRLRVDGCLTDKVGDNYTIPTLLDKSIGINKELSVLSEMSDSEEVVMLYQRSFNNKNYYVPKSIDAKKGDNKINTIYNAIEVKPNTYLGLKKVKEYSYIDLTKAPVIDEQKVSLDITKEGMVDEVTISKDLYELMSLTFDYSDLDYRVNLTYEGETYAVDGLIDEEDYQVSSFIYNEVKL